jgi:Na+-transporting methylmalonyl-CoA/oxaloacetate decarboxylase gamma subunit
MNHRDGGSAIVEWVWLSVLLMLPLVYVVLAVGAVQRAAFATTAAAREAGRAYATAASDDDGERRAELAAAVVMRDQGVRWAPRGRVVQCGGCDFSPGSAFVVELRTTVPLPFVPRWLCGHRCLAGISVSGRHRERVDCYRGTGSITGAARC